MIDWKETIQSIFGCLVVVSISITATLTSMPSSRRASHTISDLFSNGNEKNGRTSLRCYTPLSCAVNATLDAPCVRCTHVCSLSFAAETAHSHTGLPGTTSSHSPVATGAQIDHLVKDSSSSFQLALDTAVAAALVERRGTCPRGMREHMDPISNTMRCVVQRAYPDAVIREASMPEATTCARRACGNWIDTYAISPFAVQGDGFSFIGADKSASEMWRQTSERINQGDALATRPASKLMSECRRIVERNTVLLDARVSYRRMQFEIAGRVHNTLDALREAASLAARGCTGFVDASVVSLGGGIDSVETYDGTMDWPLGELDKQKMLEMITHLGENATYAKITSDSIQLLEVARSNLCGILSGEGLVALLEGFANADSLHDILASAHSTGVQRAHLTWTAAFSCLLRDNEHTAPESATLSDRSKEFAISLLSGVAAACVASVADLVVAHSDEVSSTATYTDVSHRRPSRIGRALRNLSRQLGPTADYDEPTKEDLRSASWMGGPSSKVRQLAHRRWTTVGGPVPPNAASSCFNALREKATVLAESELYATVVAPSLASRLESMVPRIQEAVAATALEFPFSNIFVDPPAVANIIRSVKFRIAGAPSTSWAGPSAPLRHELLEYERDRGLLLTLLDHYGSATADEIRLALDTNSITDPCDQAPLFDSAEPNAYYWGLHRCVMIQLGILHAPWADVLFDDTSLLLRIGFVIAHEFAHASSHVARYTIPYEAVLASYTLPSTREEAIADVLALAAIARLPEVATLNLDAIVMHVGQLFCAVPYSEYVHAVIFPSMKPTHPPGNTRVDDLCSTADRWLGL